MAPRKFIKQMFEAFRTHIRTWNSILHHVQKAQYKDFLIRLFLSRSSHSEAFCKKFVLKNFAKFTGKQLCHSLFLKKVVGLRPATLLKKLWHRCIPVNFVKFLSSPIFTEHLWWLLLSFPSFEKIFFTLKHPVFIFCCFFDSFWKANGQR